MIQGLQNVGIVVNDLTTVTAFFVDLDLELEGQAPVEGSWVDRVVGIDDIRLDVAMMRSPDGHSRLELMRFHSPTAIGETGAPPNALGLRRIMFAVKDIDSMVADLQSRGIELMGEVVRFENYCRLCYLRGPEGIIVALPEQLSPTSTEK